MPKDLNTSVRREVGGNLPAPMAAKAITSHKNLPVSFRGSCSRILINFSPSRVAEFG